eukprot:5278981-Pyramimonas_sp.AAC.1
MAALILKRLQDAGAEDRLTATQFGFRRGRGTSDALHAVRRYVELAYADKHGGVAFVALDWTKAFDSINVGALLDAWRNFG